MRRYLMTDKMLILDMLDGENCGIEFTLKKMGGKWKPMILWFLAKNGTKRYGEIRRFIPNVTNKMLSQQLKELASDKLIKRKDYKTIPPKVEYSLTKEGETLVPILDLMCAWGFERENK
jgi:DNA-binding HxlR family transcriptional regulator